MKNEKLLTTKQAAEMLGLTPMTLSIWRCRGYGPDYVKLNGRTVRYRMSSILRFLDASRVEISEGVCDEN